MSVTERDEFTKPENPREAVFAPQIGENGERCEECGAPLAQDQRYCLDCGARRGAARLPFMEVIEARLRRGDGGTQEDVVQSAQRAYAPVTYSALPRSALAGGALALFAVVLGLGILIGSLVDGGNATQVAAAPPQVIRLSAPAAASAPAANEAFTSDWPAGKDGFTVALQELSKDSAQPAQVAAAKQAATAKGAPGVGALDADDYDSLDPGNYVVYSGVFTTRKQARAALRRLRGDFTGARVVEVASGSGDPNALSGKKKEATVDRNQLKQLQKLSPKEYQDKSRKLPDTTKLPGNAPPKDNKKPGGGKGGGDLIE